ncbi:putative methyltransferase NSUN7 isoform X2 [Neocloeon triangulifer]|nr:putative methyltransferase NSUN7 isoform X2 [Neocloeon triangulifer]XP_059481613.1 putative methyltransferase NSUN7 isoform X2 [Neocloeon triangulifer]XP_059481614.1 putative methyltransferase NSUN7 isoform X2 [Neocloeon triangulifer]
MLVHLLLCRLYQRRFHCREPPCPSELRDLWQKARMAEVEEALWSVRVRLAAALARLRIKSHALTLEQLLPQTLQNRKECRDECLVPTTLWINTCKIRRDDALSVLEESGFVIDGPDEKVTTIRQDKRCPGLLHHHPSLRINIAQSELVQEGLFVLQARAFCVGPATFCYVLDDFALTGTVIQSHAHSPRTSAYLATLLASCTANRPLIVFGTGAKKTEYEKYLRSLSISNVYVRAEKFSELSPDSDILDGAVALLANPPNSLSAVQDPVDLACSSGGNLHLLEEMAVAAEETCFQAKERQETLEEEQRATLRLALSAPQLQVVVFESHSILPQETRQLLIDEMEAANEAAREKVATAPSLVRAHSFGEESVIFDRDPDEGSMTTELMTARSNSTITVPATDLFEIAPLQPKKRHEIENEEDEADMCPSLQEDGCFLALLKRQEITRLDAQYMIQIAESRGLFGGRSKKSPYLQRKAQKKKSETVLRDIMMRNKNKQKELECGERVSQPTIASMLRNSRSCSPDHSADCPRRAKAAERPPDLHARFLFNRRQDARRWWREAARRVLSLLRTSNPNAMPRFRLVRTPVPGPGATNRAPYPLSVHSLEFHDDSGQFSEDDDSDHSGSV